MTACPPPVIRRSQHLDEKQPHGFNWTLQFSRLWGPNLPFAADVAVRPLSKQTGLQYRSSGGQSTDEEPDWPDEAGDTVEDGAITWTAEAIDTDSLELQIASDTWDVEPTANITITPAAPDVEAGLQRTGVVVEATAAGEYVLTNTVTVTPGALEFIGKIYLTVE